MIKEIPNPKARKPKKTHPWGWSAQKAKEQELARRKKMERKSG